MKVKCTDGVFRVLVTAKRKGEAVCRHCNKPFYGSLYEQRNSFKNHTECRGKTKETVK